MMQFKPSLPPLNCITTNFFCLFIAGGKAEAIKNCGTNNEADANPDSLRKSLRLNCVAMLYQLKFR